MIEKLRNLVKKMWLDENQAHSLEKFFDYASYHQRELFINGKIKQRDFMKAYRAYARSIFEEREIFITSMNELINTIIENDLFHAANDRDNPGKGGQIDKIYDSTEMKVKILKFLQGSRHGKTREAIAEHFNISVRALNNRLKALQDDENHILGTKVAITVERGTNLYDSTTHPIFLALNLTEVYGLLLCLMSADEKLSSLDSAITNIIKDVVNQLTDYAKDILKNTGLPVDDYATDGPRSFRQEPIESNYLHAMKTGSDCQLVLYDHEKPIIGKPKLSLDSENAFLFIPNDGSAPLYLKAEDIKEFIDLSKN